MTSQVRTRTIRSINRAARAYGISYNRLIRGLRAAGLEVRRDVLAQLAAEDTEAFASLVRLARREART